MIMRIKQDGRSLIKGIHHVTALASDANVNNRFFTHGLGLRRVKQTVNFDAPDIYHLYYGDELGRPGTIMTYFPFPHMRQGRHGAGEASTVVFSVPKGAIVLWKRRLTELGVEDIKERQIFGETRLVFKGPDGEQLELVENEADARQPWHKEQIPPEIAIHGFHAVSLCLADHRMMSELLSHIGYEETDTKDNWHRFRIAGGNGADIIDIETVANELPAAQQGAGSIHHVAFAVEDHEAQLTVREALLDIGYAVTPVVDRKYFSSVYFRAPGGVLFEIATSEPGFIKDEDAAHLVEGLRLPRRHEHMRKFLLQHLKPLED